LGLALIGAEVLWGAGEGGSLLRAEDGVRTAGGTSGISYRNEKNAEKPLSVHIVKVERNRPDLVLTTTLAKGTVLDLSPLSEQMKGQATSNARPVVGINGDFYRTEQEPFAGDPLGFQVMEGELISSPHANHPSFWTDAKGAPHVGVVTNRFQATLPGGVVIPFEINEERLRGTARVYTPRLGASTRSSGEGKELVLERDGTGEWLPIKPCHTYTARIREIRTEPNTKLTPDTLVLSVEGALAAGLEKVHPGETLTLAFPTEPQTLGCETAIGGGPTLLRNGQTPDYKARDERHPRSAFGWNDTHWFFVEVDGRQSNLSIGMKLPELSEYLAKLGVKEAINLDGGGSATLWLYGQVVNSPCYGYERNTANGLVILRKETPRREPD